MTQRLLKEVVALLWLVIKSDRFGRVFTQEEGESIIRAYDALKSASHYPDPLAKKGEQNDKARKGDR